MRQRMLLLATYLLIVISCVPPQQGVVVTLRGVSAEVVTLEILTTYDGRSRLTTVDHRVERFGLEVPSGTQRSLEITVSALSPDRCTVAQGSAAFLLKGDRLDEVLVELRALDAAQCHAEAQHIADGISISKVSVGQGRVTSDIGGLDCGATCTAAFLRGAVITLTAQPEPGSYFVRWLGACRTTSSTCQVAIAGMASVKAVFASKVCLTSHVCWESPLPQGNALRVVWGLGPQDVWAAGERGTILHYDGYSWASVPSPIYNELSGIWGSAHDDVWVVGDGVTLHWDGRVLAQVTGAPGARAVWGSGANDVWFVGNGVQHWNGVTLRDFFLAEIASKVRGVWGSGPRDVWFVGNPGGSTGELLHWNGETLSLAGVLQSEELQSIWGLDPSNLWIASNAVQSFWWNGNHFEPATARCRVAWGLKPDTLWSTCHERWTGTVWERLAPGESRAVWGSSPQDVWFVGDDGSLRHWDGATTEVAWSRVTDQALMALSGSSPSDVWAITDTSVLRGDGVTFKEVPRSDPVNTTLRAVYSSKTDGTWAVGNRGLIEHWDGVAFRPVPSGTTAPLVAVWAGSGEVWAVGSAGSVVRWNGASFSKVESGTTASLVSVWGSGPSDIWAVGSRGTVLHWNGAVLSLVPTGSTGNINFVWGTAANDVYLLGGKPNSWRWTGATLVKLDIGSLGVGTAAWMSGAKDIWAAGTDISRWDGVTATTLFGGAYRTVDWLNTPPTKLYGLWGAGRAGPGGEVWAVGEAGTILRYRP